jgi:aerobic C4-dicarboxylate transport protein
VIFLTIVTGIAGMTHLRTVGRVFGKAMAYFLFFSTLALVVGLVVANVVQPGAGMNIDPATSTGRSMATCSKSHEMTLVGFLLDIIPDTLVSAFVTDGNILQVLFCRGAVRHRAGAGRRPRGGRCRTSGIADHPGVQAGAHPDAAAPIGAFGAMAFTIGKYGWACWCNLALLVGSSTSPRCCSCW